MLSEPFDLIKPMELVDPSVNTNPSINTTKAEIKQFKDRLTTLLSIYDLFCLITKLQKIKFEEIKREDEKDGKPIIEETKCKVCNEHNTGFKDGSIFLGEDNYFVITIESISYKNKVKISNEVFKQKRDELEKSVNNAKATVSNAVKKQGQTIKENFIDSELRQRRLNENSQANIDLADAQTALSRNGQVDNPTWKNKNPKL